MILAQSGSLVIQANIPTIDNSGTLGVIDAGTLFLAGVVNNVGGTILASDIDSMVNLDYDSAATINGGTLTTQYRGVVGIDADVAPATLNGVTISTGSTYTVSDGDGTILEGTITNQGTIALDANRTSTYLYISGVGHADRLVR